MGSGYSVRSTGIKLDLQLASEVGASVVGQSPYLWVCIGNAVIELQNTQLVSRETHNCLVWKTHRLGVRSE